PRRFAESTYAKYAIGSHILQAAQEAVQPKDRLSVSCPFQNTFRFERTGGSRDFEQSCRSHPAPDTHGDHDVLYTPPLALNQAVSDHARAAHSVWMPDRDGAAINIETLIGDAELVAAIDYLAGECFVQFPQADIVHLQPVALEQFRNRVHRSDTH